MSKKILLVDDDIALRNILREFFEKENFVVLESGNGDEAIESVLVNKPDVVLLDVVLPRKSGFQVLEILRSREETKNLPVIMLTNLESAEDIEKSVRFGAFMYMVKSEYEMEDIVLNVKRALSKGV